MLRASVFVVAFVVGCGSDVDLGGSFDAAAGDGAMRDGGASDARPCGVLNPPDAPSECVACDRTLPSCQPNGCYNGYYCNTATRDCRSPPSSCDDAGK